MSSFQQAFSHISPDWMTTLYLEILFVLLLILINGLLAMSELAMVSSRRNRLEHMTVVVDEYGVTEGVATLTDLLKSIAGELPESGEAAKLLIVQRDDGSWLVDGTLPVDEFEDRIGLRGLQEQGDFHTVAGFVLWQFHHLPTAGESFRYGDAQFEVVNMDGRRIDKILVQPAVDPALQADSADSYEVTDPSSAIGDRFPVLLVDFPRVKSSGWS